MLIFNLLLLIEMLFMKYRYMIIKRKKTHKMNTLKRARIISSSFYIYKF